MTKPTTHLIVVSAVDIPRHAKVSYLDNKSFTHQAVSGGQVSVNEMLRGQVLHAGSHMAGYAQQFWLRQWWRMR